MKKISYIIALSVVLISCSTQIEDIRKKKYEYLGKKITLTGTVSMAIPFTSIYEFKDETGEIYVETSQDLPSTDEEFTLEGIVREKKIEAGGFQLMKELYIEESTRK
jgi:hypothetical protein